MARVIKKSKKKRKEKVEQKSAEHKATGKDLSQSGSFLQKYKDFVTWGLVIAFALTCIGITSFTSCSGNHKTQTADLNEASGPLRDLEFKISSVKGEADRLATPDNIINLALAYQAAADEINDIPDLSLADYNKKKQEYLKLALENYEKAVNISTSTNSELRDLALINLSEMYLDNGNYKKAAEFALSDDKVNQLAKAPAGDIKELLNKLMDAGKSPEGIQLEDTSFLPGLATYLVAKIRLGDYGEVKELANIANDYSADPALSLAIADAEYKLGNDEKVLSVSERFMNNIGAEIMRIIEFTRNSAPGDIRITHNDLKNVNVIVSFMELLGDLNMKEGKNLEASGSYDQALQLSYLFNLAEKSKILLEKRAKTGIPLPQQSAAGADSESAEDSADSSMEGASGVKSDAQSPDAQADGSVSGLVSDPSDSDDSTSDSVNGDGSDASRP